MDRTATYTAFADESLIASGPLEKLLPVLKEKFDHKDCPLILIFNDETGKQVDFELRGTLEGVLAAAIPGKPVAGPGRPKLGVVSREISLLPRHWEWLEEQPSGASAAIRRLVDDARKRDPSEQKVRLAKDATGRFLSAMAGNRPGYEEATRALYAGNMSRFQQLIRPWPKDIRRHAEAMAESASPV